MAIQGRPVHRIMCKDQYGNDLVMTFSLTRNGKAVAARRDTGPALVMMTPQVLSEMVAALRDLQVQALKWGW